MRTKSKSMAAVGAVAVAIGLAGVVVYPQVARSALDHETRPEASQRERAQAAVEQSRSPEIAIVAREIAAILDAAPESEREIGARLHRQLSDAAQGDKAALVEALEVVLESELTREQSAALRRIYSHYSPDDLAPPSGGAARYTGLRGAATLAAPGPGGARLTVQSDPVVPPETGGGDPVTPPETGGGDPVTPPETGGGDPVTPPETGGGDPVTPPETGGGDPVTPPETGGGDPVTPPETGGGDPVTPPETGGGDPVVPPPVDEDPVAPPGDDTTPVTPPPLPPGGGGSDYRT